MKPCRKYRRRIALLAFEAVPRPDWADSAHVLMEEDQALRTHIACCAACRRYLAEMSQLSGRLAAAANDRGDELEASRVFHHRILRALGAAKPKPGWRNVVAFARTHWLGWQVALPVLGATAALTLAVLAYRQSHPADHVTDRPITQEAVSRTEGVPAPSLTEYLAVANRSLDQLDDLLTRQGRRNLPPAPVYTASTWPAGGP